MKKKLSQEIRRTANKLPACVYPCLRYKYEAKLDKNGLPILVNGRPKLERVAIQTYNQVNHHNRLKRAFVTDGAEGVTRYINSLEKNLRLWRLSDGRELLVLTSASQRSAGIAEKPSPSILSGVREKTKAALNWFKKPFTALLEKKEGNMSVA